MMWGTTHTPSYAAEIALARRDFVAAFDADRLLAPLAAKVACHLNAAEDFEGVLSRFAVQTPTLDDPVLLYQVAIAAYACGQRDTADLALRRSCDVGYAPALGQLAERLFDTGDINGAADAAEKALAADPKAVRPFSVLGRVMIARRAFDRLAALCDERADNTRWNAYLPSYDAIARRGGVAGDCAQPWFDSRLLVVERNLFGEKFNRSLTDWVVANEDRKPLPETRSTRGTGFRLDGLTGQPSGLLAELFEAVRTAVERYVSSETSTRVNLPIARKPGFAEINAWSVVVRQDGHESWHIHPDGWLSGVYYLQVPRTTHPAGSIAFSPYWLLAPHQELTKHALARGDILLLAPEPGTLILFPSYFPHRTYPTGADSWRVCISFDIIPMTSEPTRDPVLPHLSLTGTPMRPRAGLVTIHGESGSVLVADTLGDGLWSFNGVAAAIWEALENNITHREIVLRLQKTYDQPAKILAADVSKFLGQLAALDLLAWAGASHDVV